MDSEITSGWRCNIAGDGMSATVFLVPPSGGVSYAVEHVTAFLRQNGVTNGVVYSEIDNLLKAGNYYKDVEVARGREPYNGTDGYYDFKFQLGEIKNPVIRPDGSVDYSSMTIVHSVKKGDLLAVYHPAEKGAHGYDVKGREMRCKPGKELAVLRGTGFISRDDGVYTKYYADMDGRVDYEDKKLYIRDVYEHRGDLDLVTGRIDFRGDVVVTGNVRSGTMIRASKSITVNGSVEAATLIAEGDIVLKKGMQGGGKSRIVCGGNLYANFVEFTDVDVKGNIEANIALNCRMKAGKNIVISGKRGSIVGGNVYSATMIKSGNLGNKAEVKTTASLGMLPDVRKRYEMLKLKQQITASSISEAKNTIGKIKDVRINHEPKEVREAKVAQIVRKLKRDERLLEHINKELNDIKESAEIGMNGSIMVEQKVYPGVKIEIDEEKMDVTSELTAVEFVHRPGTDGIEMRNL